MGNGEKRPQIVTRYWPIQGSSRNSPTFEELLEAARQARSGNDPAANAANERQASLDAYRFEPPGLRDVGRESMAVEGRAEVAEVLKADS